MSTKFLTAGGSSLTDGTADLYVRTIACSTFAANTPCKTNGAAIIATSLLQIADVQGLAAALSGFVTNPLQPAVPFNVNSNSMTNVGPMSTPAGAGLTLTTPVLTGGFHVYGDDTSIVPGFNTSIWAEDTVCAITMRASGSVYANTSVETPRVHGAGNLAVVSGGNTFIQPGVLGGLFDNNRHVASLMFSNNSVVNYSPAGAGFHTCFPVGTSSTPFNFPANFFQLPCSFRFKIAGTFTQVNALAPCTISWQLVGGPAGSTVIFAFTSDSSGMLVTNHIFDLDLLLSVTASGVTGRCVAFGKFTQTDVTTGNTIVTQTTNNLTLIDTTGINIIDLQYSHSQAGANIGTSVAIVDFI